MIEETHKKTESGAYILSESFFDIRFGPSDRINIGKNSVISCRITLERDVGEVNVGADTYIGGSHIICAENITIGSDVLIAWGCTIVDHDSHSIDWRDRSNDVKKWREGLLSGGVGKAAELKNWEVVPMAEIIIKDKSWIGFGSMILKGVTIGEGSVIAAGSVVTKNVPDWTIAGGNPARFIKEIDKS